MPDVTEALRGGVDLHCHSAPSFSPRKLDDFALAEEARAAGFAAVVLKGHEGDSSDRAMLATLKTGFPVYGGVSLNHFVGGFNPWAVEASLLRGGRVVWMPTIHARHFIRLLGERDMPIKGNVPMPDSVAGGLWALDDDGRLLPEVHEILRLCAEHGAMIANGHLGPEETLAITRACAELGIADRVVVQHPDAPFSVFSLDQQHELAALGATLEKCFLLTLESFSDLTAEALAATVGELGAEHCALVTDLGQTHNPSPATGIVTWAEAMVAAGVSEADVRVMFVDVPRRLLGLEAHAG